MMKRLLTLAACALLTLTLAACGDNSTGDTADGKSPSIDAITTANSAPTLLASHGFLSENYIEYDLAGNTVMNQSIYVLTSGDDVRVYRDSNTLLAAETNNMYAENVDGVISMYALTPDDYTDDCSMVINALSLVFSDGETITECIKDGENYIITTSVPISDEIAEYLEESYGLAPTESTCEYIVEQETLFVKNIQTFFVVDDTQYLLAETNNSYDSDFALPVWYDCMLSSESQITVIKDYGDPDEATYTFSVPDGTTLLTDYYTLDGYTLAADQAGKNPASEMRSGNTYYFVATK